MKFPNSLLEDKSQQATHGFFLRLHHKRKSVYSSQISKRAMKFQLTTHPFQGRCRVWQQGYDPPSHQNRTRIGCELVMQLRMALNNWLFCLHLLRARLYRRLISDLWLFLRCLKANVPVPVEKLLKFCFPFPSSPSPPQQQNPWNKTTAPTFYEFPHWDLVVIFVKLDKVLHMLNPRT